MTPDYLGIKLPPRRRTSLFNPNVTLSFREIRCRSSRYANSFFPDAVSSWNRIISNFTTMPSISILKSHLLSLFRPIHKSTFNIHDPTGLRFLFMMRLNLSPQRSHKWNYNFAATPSEICRCNQSVENTSHFLLHCPLFANPRLTLLNTANELGLKYNLPDTETNYRFFLYGHHLLNQINNKRLLLATIRFVKDTKRFTSD